MTLRKPSIFFRAMILGAQGVFYNLFCNSRLFHVIRFFYSLNSEFCPTLFPRPLVIGLLHIWRRKPWSPSA